MTDKESRDWEKCLLRNSPRKPKPEANRHHHHNHHHEQPHQQQFHPIYNEISLMNGRINRMNLHEMKTECKVLRLNCNGKKETVKRRLKEYHKTEKLFEAGLSNYKDSNPDFFIVIDFEATCEERNPIDYQHEIIEFPAVLVQVRTGDGEPRIVDEFHGFCRPRINTELSDFCRNLTRIAQSTVDAAEPFIDVHERFLRWLEKHRLGTENTFALITDGPFDMGRFLYLQVNQTEIDYPEYAKHWVNIRKAFANFYKRDFYEKQQQHSNNAHQAKLPGLQTMLDSLGMEFQGQPHSGLDDARNIARIVVRMIADRAALRINEKIVLKDKNDSDKADICQEVNQPRLKSVTFVNKHEAESWMKTQKKRVKMINNN